MAEDEADPPEDCQTGLEDWVADSWAGVPGRLASVAASSTKFVGVSLPDKPPTLADALAEAAAVASTFWVNGEVEEVAALDVLRFVRCLQVVL